MKVMDWHTAQVEASLREIRLLVFSMEANQPPRSTKPIVGRLVNVVRDLAWKLIGLRPLLVERNHQLLELLSKLLTTLPRPIQQSHALNLYFRRDTKDWEVFEEVYLQNEYRLPDRLEPDAVIIDVGMHIGSFSFAALARGAGKLYGFEVDAGNFALAERNLSPFGDRARVQRRAVWRSDRVGDILYADRVTTANTGGNTILWSNQGETLETVALDDIIDEATEQGRKRVAIMKIDCEGSEYPILLTSKKLHLIDRILGEFHEFDSDGTIIPAARVAGVERYTGEEIAAHLRRFGFAVEIHRFDDCRLGLFFATHAQAPVLPLKLSA